MSSDFLGVSEIAAIGFASAGDNLSISRHAQFFAPQRISIGDNTRIDTQCVLSAGPNGLSVGCHVHVSAMCTILGRGRVEIEDFCTISVRCSIFSSNDDYSGASMTNPTVPAEYRHATDGLVRIGTHAILGTGCVVLPQVIIGESASVGALSLVKVDVPAFAIVAGTPARIIGQRRREHRAFAEKWLADR